MAVVESRPGGRVRAIDKEREGAGSATGTTALGGSVRNPTNPHTSSPLANPTCACGDPLGEPLDISRVAMLLGCSAWTVRQRYLPAGLPCFRIAKTGKLTFYRNQIIRWVLEQQDRERR
jgi:hypothetical protein